MAKTEREIARELRKVKKPGGVDKADLPILSIPLLMSDADEHELVWTDPDLGLARLANGQLYRWLDVDPLLDRIGDDDG